MNLILAYKFGKRGHKVFKLFLGDIVILVYMGFEFLLLVVQSKMKNSLLRPINFDTIQGVDRQFSNWSSFNNILIWIIQVVAEIYDIDAFQNTERFIFDVKLNKVGSQISTFKNCLNGFSGLDLQERLEFIMYFGMVSCKADHTYFLNVFMVFWELDYQVVAHKNPAIVWWQNLGHIIFG